MLINCNNAKLLHKIAPCTRIKAFFILFLFIFVIFYSTTSFSSDISDQAEQRAQVQEEQRKAQQSKNDQRTREAVQGKGSGEEIKLVDPGTYPDSEAPCFAIERLKMQGLSPDIDISMFDYALDAVTSGEGSAVGRCLGIKGINVVLSRVQNALIGRGFVTTRVLATSQNLKSGELILTIVPGMVKDVRFTDDSSARGHWWNALPLSPGDVLNLRDIEQGLDNLKHVPTAEADIKIEPSAKSEDKINAIGQSDLVIAYQQKLPIRASFSLDDSGSKETGKYQGTATISYDQPFTLNDQLYVTWGRELDQDATSGTKNYVISYSIPAGYWNMGWSLSGSTYYQTVAGLNAPVVYSGDSRTLEFNLERLIYRDASSKTKLKTSLKDRRAHNFIEDTEVEVQRRHTAVIGIDLNHNQTVGSSNLDITLGFQRGIGAFGAISASEEDLGTGTSRFSLATLQADLTVPFEVEAPWIEQDKGQKFTYRSRFKAQTNFTPLTPQDRFAIGGRNSVRGTDGILSLTGERGFYWRNEWGMSLGDSGQELFAGIDYGQVAGPSSEALLGKHLTGGVLGLRGTIGPDWAPLWYETFIGTPVSKPEGFRSRTATLGFNLNVSF